MFGGWCMGVAREKKNAKNVFNIHKYNMISWSYVGSFFWYDLRFLGSDPVPKGFKTSTHYQTNE